jgi:hypothetical protein
MSKNKSFIGGWRLQHRLLFVSLYKASSILYNHTFYYKLKKTTTGTQPTQIKQTKEKERKNRRKANNQIK